MMRILISVFFLGGFVRSSAAEPDKKVDFSRDVKPILAKNCFACHGPDDAHRAVGLRFDQREIALKGTKKGAALSPGKPDASRIIVRVTAADADDRMPPKETGHKLTEEQIATLKKWIAQGAEYSQHWAFVKPSRPEVPAVQNKAWAKNSIDYFILQQVEQAGLQPMTPADKYILLRRLSLDLRGLPPTPQEFEAFAKDNSPDAYQKIVDRFLADPAFGERWARMWLDLARYADSAGYGSDPLRTNIWPYRDWVIDALNQNMPFDQFTIEQLAGDLLPNATPRQKLATAFHRNTMTNTEGGTDDEEFRVAAVKDRVDTTIQVWMGVTMGCAKCHNHKFDPISQKEYYQLYSLFNQTADNDRPDEAPTMSMPTPWQEEQLKRIQTRLTELQKQMDAASPRQEQAFEKWRGGLFPNVAGKAIEISSVTAQSGMPMAKGESASWKMKGHGEKSFSPFMKTPAKDVYTIRTTVTEKNIVGFRIEVPPLGGVRDAANSFLIDRIRIDAGEAGKGPAGRIVRIEIPGVGKMLSLAEVQVFHKEANIATKGTASQSSTDYGGEAKRAIDGNTEGKYEANSVTHTKVENNPWWEVKLAENAEIDQIVIWNRRDGLEARLSNYRVSLLSEDRKVIWSRDEAAFPNPTKQLVLSGPQPLNVADAYGRGSRGGDNALNVILPGEDGPTGWTGAPTKSEDSLYLVFDKPLALPVGAPLTFQIKHSGLAHFRIHAVTDPAIQVRVSLPANIRNLVEKEGLSPAQVDTLRKYYRTIDPALKALRDEIAQLEKSKPQPVAVPVMEELPANKHRKTKIMIKGNFLELGDEVQGGLPGAFPGLPKEIALSRLAVARWLVSPDNPLTARVAVNRFWAQLFGRGLVETEEDFGTQGEFPTHPELLDWLAMEFMSPADAKAKPWDVKHMLRLMLKSATYQQSSKATAETLKRDPKNLLYARAPRYRLEAEMVRDQALALSGLLSKKMGGPSVYPPQPGGLWQAAFNGQRTWATSSGEDKYRRGVYTFWRRTIPYPSMTTFDAPSRETCAIRRIRTNTPLQAFVTLNDPVYVESAQALARRIVKEGGASTEERVKFGLQLCLGRPAQEAQVRALSELFVKQQERFRKDAPAAKTMATDPLGPVTQGMNEADLAAWTVVANVLLNMDSVLTRN
jgi:mono/diheme cytochrome c family protein